MSIKRMFKRAFWWFVGFWVTVGFLMLVSSVCSAQDSLNVGASSGGRVLSSSGTYLGARDATTGSTDNLYIFGQHATYYVHRLFMRFDLSGLSADSMNITTDTRISLKGAADYSTVDFDWSVFSSDWDGTLSSDDFVDIAGWQSSGAYSAIAYTDTLNTSAFNSSSGNILHFTQVGADSLEAALGGYFEIAVLSLKDVSSTSNGGSSEYVLMSGTASDHFLTIYYTEPSGGGATAEVLCLGADGREYVQAVDTSGGDAPALRADGTKMLIDTSGTAVPVLIYPAGWSLPKRATADTTLVPQ